MTVSGSGRSQGMMTTKTMKRESMKTSDDIIDVHATIVGEGDVKEQGQELAVAGQGSYAFRELVPEKRLADIKRVVPQLATKVVSSPSAIISYKESVLKGVNELSERLIDEQKGVSIPEADNIINGVLHEIDGYSSKYSPEKMNSKMSAVKRRLFGPMYAIKAMKKDALPIAGKLDEVSVEIQKMEIGLRDNAARGRVLRKKMIDSLGNIVDVIAILEELKECLGNDIEKMSEVASEANGGIVEWEGQKYTPEEFDELMSDYGTALSEAEKTWFNWRQKYFLYIANIVSSRNIIQVSMTMERTCRRIRVDAIPAARTQLAAWQQAEFARQSASKADTINEGVDRLISASIKGSTDAVSSVMSASTKAMISDQTVLDIADNIRRQFQIMLDAESEAKAARQRNLALIENGEEAIVQAAEDALRESIRRISGNETGNRKLIRSAADADILDLDN